VSFFPHFKHSGNSRVDFISVVASAFALSPAIGYIIYQLYDWLFYSNRLPRDKGRKALDFLGDLAVEEEFPEKGRTLEFHRKKELIDFTLYCGHKNTDFKISEQISDTLRGFWSHVAARYVSSIFVPISCGIFFCGLLILDYFSVLNIPFNESIDNKNFPLILLIVLLSICIWIPSRRIKKEAFALEEYIIRAREKTVRDYMRLEKKQTEAAKQQKRAQISPPWTKPPHLESFFLYS